MIKPQRLHKGDSVAVVSLSAGLLGEDQYEELFWKAKSRLEQCYGLNVVTMPHTLSGNDYIYEHPWDRAQDLMDAFRDTNIQGIICAMGGDDTIRLLPYIDFDVIRQNPKIFTGFSDTTTNHLMMYHAGLISYYAPDFLTFAAFDEADDYTFEAVERVLFKAQNRYQIRKCPYYYNDEEKLPDEQGYELLQGSGVVRGRLLGGCLEAFFMSIGTEIWPKSWEWKNKILFLEISNDCPQPQQVLYYLRNLGAQGILQNAAGILFGKPFRNVYYNEYKDVILQAMYESQCEHIPVLYNVNFGHQAPINVIPYGIMCELNADLKRITLLEKAVK